MTRDSRPTLPLAVLFAMLLGAPPAHGFVYTDQTLGLADTGNAVVWPHETIAMALQTNGGGGAWNDSFEVAMNTMNQVGSDISWVVAERDQPTGPDPCIQDDGINVTAWRTDNCGSGWGDITAVTKARYLRIGGVWRLDNTDVLFNSTRTWTPDQPGVEPFVGGTRVLDFHRVALHELGHAMGLGHPEELGQTQRSIMVSAQTHDPTDPVFTLQADDLAGILFLYPATRSARPGTGGLDPAAGGATSTPGSGGCSVTGTTPDPTLALMALGALGALWRRRGRA